MAVEAVNKSGLRHKLTREENIKGGKRAAKTNKKSGHFERIGKLGGIKRALNAGQKLKNPPKSPELVEMGNKVFPEE